MRADSIGLFWQDEAKIKKAPKEKRKIVPPYPFWLEPSYLPGLEEARLFKVELFTDAELVIAQAKGERLVWDIESYPNYTLIAFKSIVSKKIVYFEMYDSDNPDESYNKMDLKKLAWVLSSFTIISFNGLHYDEPIARIALTGRPNSDIHFATEAIIVRGERPYEVLRGFKATKKKDAKAWDHIDIKEVAPLHDSLKKYAGRMHTKRMQDLPFAPGVWLSPDQRDITRFYCVNDLRCTEELYNELLPAIVLREAMSKEYRADVRSKSDAQVAEAVILNGLKALTGQQRFEKPQIEVGRTFYYQIPKYIKYESALLNWVLDNVRHAKFVIDHTGEVIKPEGFPLEFRIADADYTMGIGGLHSKEKKVSHYAGEDWFLIDRDVASFYPRVILTQQLYPKHLGPAFLKVYNSIVERRLAAKDQAKNLKDIWKKKGLSMPADVQAMVDELTTTADSLKITINGSFGKFGNGYSMLYSPNLMIQVTLTGQLVLLMLIERLELAGIKVISANTDGIVIKCHKTQKEKLDEIVKQWETDIDCKTEETYYKSIHNRDVNSYFAIKTDGEVKVKGAFSEKGSAGNSILSKDPSSLIASDAVKKFLLDSTSVDETIRACKDIRRFVTVRYVGGDQIKGGVKVYSEPGKETPETPPNEYLGKVIRWYYSTSITGDIVYAETGKKVGSSDGARPCMALPDEFPEDINYDFYITKARKILKQIGVLEEA